MRLRLSAQLNNAAFHDGKPDGERYDRAAVAQMLVQAADRIYNGDDAGNLRDVNGNTVGQWSVR